MNRNLNQRLPYGITHGIVLFVAITSRNAHGNVSVRHLRMAHFIAVSTSRTHILAELTLHLCSAVI